MKRLIILFLLINFNKTYGQTTFTSFIYDDSINLGCNQIKETNDNGFILSCSSDIGINFEILNKSRLIKLNNKGNIIWDKIYSETSSSEFSNKIVKTSDNGFLLVSNSYSYPILDEDTISDILVRKIDSRGNIEWQKVYPARSFTDVIQTSDNSYLLLGQVHEQNGYFSSDIIVYKIDLKGNIIWNNRYGLKNKDYPSYWESPHNIYEFDNTYYISGKWHRSDSSLYSNGFIYKIDNLGNKNWKLNFPYIHTRVHINSIFKFKNDLYFNSANNELFLIDNSDGTYLDTNLKLQTVLRDKKNYSIDCNIITTLEMKDSSIIFNQLNSLETSFFTNTTKNISIPFAISSRKITYMQKTKDGGFVYIRPSNNFYETIVTKTDCLGNDTYWSTDCNSKLKEENNMTIYPNPTNKLLNIETNYNITNTEIINILGQTINYNNYCNCNKQTINIENLPKGNYFIHIKGNNLINTAKFTKH